VEERLYEFFEHTADIGIKVKAKTLKELFQNAALAMFDIIAHKLPTTQHLSPKSKTYIIKQEADTLDELLINWLNELLSLSATKDLIFFDVRIHKLNDKNLQATVAASPVENYELNTEIKAATYHGLKLKRNKSDWQAEVIFDV